MIIIILIALMIMMMTMPMIIVSEYLYSLINVGHNYVE